ncbi:MAG: IPT/TIG domain-containing protein [Terriglobales bacterium]
MTTSDSNLSSGQPGIDVGYGMPVGNATSGWAGGDLGLMPSISSLSQTSGLAGTSVTINGSNFGATQGTSAVTFNGMAAAPTSWTTTNIVVPVPSGATNGPVVVAVNGVVSNGVYFVAAPQTEADNFQEANGPVSANWAGTGTGNVSILNDTLDCSTSPGSQLSIYWNANSNGANQYSQVTVGATVSTTTLGPAVRVQPGGSRYRFVWWSGSYYLQYMPGTGNGTNLQIVSASAPSVGTVLTLSVLGTTLNAYVNGTLTLNASDSNLLSGQPGIDVGAGMPVGNATSGWVGGDLGALSSGLQVSPSSLSMLVGQSRTVSVTDNAGNPVIGLFWTTTNSSIVSLSTDDPPLITAVAPGSATVYAENVPVAVTVYAGSSLPAGTPIWSLSLGGSGSSSVSLAPAVPSSSGVDVFALSPGVLSAIASDGTVVWTANSIPASPEDGSTLIPDFSGNVLLKTPYTYLDAQGNSYFTHKVQKVDPNTHQLVNLYTFAAVPTTLYVPGDTIEVIAPHPTGVLFVQDSSFGRSLVTVIDPSTGNQIQQIVMNAQWPGLTNMIVAGDGNAYIAYTDSVNSPYPSELLRVSPDGSSAVIDLGNTATPYAVMPSADDQGVAVFLNSEDDSGNFYTYIDYVSQDVLVSQGSGTLTGNLAGGPYGFLPVLQREDGSYVGTPQGIEPPPSPGAPVDLPVMTMAQGGGVLWQQDLGTSVTPLYATVDGGAIVTSTQPGSSQLGTLYTLGQGGGIASQAPDTGAVYSWLGQWYDAPASAATLSAITGPAMLLAVAPWPMFQGNPSHTPVPYVNDAYRLERISDCWSLGQALRYSVYSLHMKDGSNVTGSGYVITEHQTNKALALTPQGTSSQASTIFEDAIGPRGTVTSSPVTSNRTFTVTSGGTSLGVVPVHTEQDYAIEGIWFWGNTDPTKTQVFVNGTLAAASCSQ